MIAISASMSIIRWAYRETPEVVFLAIREPILVSMEFGQDVCSTFSKPKHDGANLMVLKYHAVWPVGGGVLCL